MKNRNNVKVIENSNIQMYYDSYLYVCISYLSEGPARAGAGGGGGGY